MKGSTYVQESVERGICTVIFYREVSHFIDRFRERFQVALQAGTIQKSLRNSVFIGLSLKALDSFDRLLVDAYDRRAECSHHLKTMAESFIYAGWVSEDAGDTRARLLRAVTCPGKTGPGPMLGYGLWRKGADHATEETHGRRNHSAFANR